MMKNAYSYPLRLPMALRDKLTEAADREGLTINKFCIRAIKKAITEALGEDTTPPPDPC